MYNLSIHGHLSLTHRGYYFLAFKTFLNLERYGFAIGNVAAFDMDDPESIVSPGGVGFDINCGVRLIRTNLVRSLQLPTNSFIHHTQRCNLLPFHLKKNQVSQSSFPSSHLSSEQFHPCRKTPHHTHCSPSPSPSPALPSPARARCGR